MGSIWSLLFGGGDTSTHHNAVGGDLAEDKSADLSLVSVHNTGNGGSSALTYICIILGLAAVVLSLAWLWGMGCLQPILRPCIKRIRRRRERHRSRRREQEDHLLQVRELHQRIPHFAPAPPSPPALPPIPTDLADRLRVFLEKEEALSAPPTEASHRRPPHPDDEYIYTAVGDSTQSGTAHSTPYVTAPSSPSPSRVRFGRSDTVLFNARSPPVSLTYPGDASLADILTSYEPAYV